MRDDPIGKPFDLFFKVQGFAMSESGNIALKTSPHSSAECHESLSQYHHRPDNFSSNCWLKSVVYRFLKYRYLNLFIMLNLFDLKQLEVRSRCFSLLEQGLTTFPTLLLAWDISTTFLPKEVQSRCTVVHFHECSISSTPCTIK